MINNSKITTFSRNPQIAGVMPNDNNIEFVGVRETKQVLWIRNGSTRYFSDLPIQFFNLLKTAYLADLKAVDFLSNVTDKLNHQVELYTYYMYGELDSTPDICNGKLSTSENFRDHQNCPSLLWNSKNININNHVLTPRQLIIIDLIGSNEPDKAIASFLGISHKTFDFHKSNLFKAVGVTNKMQLLKLSLNHKIVS
ncbi:helix-turn-helix transcriptional regulator [Tenacibaculum soleae]|uniref:helix-turn-helix transcriptional regulator n=1 Tax=Tenacibaculum soleae TaxID=447689 RepID=UPI0026E46777|nr:LuxR C-terminal-related transcriptional regulator [Tenacibaculum soleae]MDO6813792.1 LuxR C-terminal-related transcriptional regulator [Tenacibaculum soleae]